MERLQWSIVFCTILVAGFSDFCTAEEKEFPRGLKWKQINTEHFTVLFDEQHRHAAQRIAHLAEAVHTDLVQFLSIDQEKEFKKRYVIITDQSDVVDQYDPALPEHELVIDLRRPHAGNSPALSAYSQDWLAQQFIYQYTTTIRHEIDGFFRKILGVPFPDAGFSGWMERGMAAYMERILYEEQGRSSYFDMILRTEVLEDRLTTLEQRAAIGVREWPGDIKESKGISLNECAIRRVPI